MGGFGVVLTAEKAYYVNTMNPVEEAFLDILPSLTDAVALEPDTLANQLMRRGLIPKRTWQDALSSSMQPADKANQLMVAIQTRLSTDPTSVEPLVEALRRVPTLAPFADRMQAAMGQGTLAVLPLLHVSSYMYI